MTNSCADPSYWCNCDKNDAVWREDSGLLTEKSALPVKELRIGDTGVYEGVDEMGYHTLGKLRCYGIADQQNTVNNNNFDLAALSTNSLEVLFDNVTQDQRNKMTAFGKNSFRLSLDPMNNIKQSYWF